MILSAHQIAYLPWLGYFDKISRAELFCLFDSVQLEDAGFENRNQIKTANGPQWLTVPVRRGRDIPANEVLICNDQGWQRKHWRSIELAYSKAPFFEMCADGIRRFYREPWEKLADLNLAMLLHFTAQLGIETPIVRASDHDFTGEKSALVLDMCLKLKADAYIFGAKGRDYADLEAFEKAGVTVSFQDFQQPEYSQLHGPFVPNMSALDALFNLGPGLLGQ